MAVGKQEPDQVMIDIAAGNTVKSPQPLLQAAIKRIAALKAFLINRHPGPRLRYCAVPFKTGRGDGVKDYPLSAHEPVKSLLCGTGPPDPGLAYSGNRFIFFARAARAFASGDIAVRVRQPELLKRAQYLMPP